MTLWDWLVLAIGAALVFEGAWKGAIRLAFGLAGLVAGFLYAGHAADLLAGTLTFLAENLRRPLALVVGFVIILASFVLVGVLMSRLAKAAGLSCLNRVAGVALGFVVAVYLCAGMVRIADRISPGLGGRMAEGPVVRMMQSWAFGMGALVPARPLPPPSPGSPVQAAKPAGDST
jgi:membrane protein required for colicin V production